MYVSICSTSEFFTAGIRSYLEAVPGIVVDPIAADVGRASAAAGFENMPAVLIVDGRTRRNDLLRSIRKAASATPDQPSRLIVVLPHRQRVATLQTLIISGVNGILHEDCGREGLEVALAAVAVDLHFVQDCFVQQLAECLPKGPLAIEQASPVSLTPQETKVLRLIAAGCSNAGIAKRLYLSSHTVRFHVSNVLRKLDVRTRCEAVALAHRTDFFTDDLADSPGLVVTDGRQACLDRQPGCDAQTSPLGRPDLRDASKCGQPSTIVRER